MITCQEDLYPKKKRKEGAIFFIVLNIKMIDFLNWTFDLSVTECCYVLCICNLMRPILLTA